jgi:hypothetical protein
MLASVLLCVSTHVQAGKLRVNSAEPSQTEQETPSLDVLINGEGFDDGTQATFLVSGTEDDTGGVTVHSTTYLSELQLRANISVDSGATIGQFDIQVRTTRGRRGKGNTLFRVLEKGGSGNQNLEDGEIISLDCTLTPEHVGDNVFSDGNDLYVDGSEKVECRTGGVAQPNLSGIRFDTLTKGSYRKAIRGVDLAFSPCAVDHDCGVLPPSLFALATSMDDMEIVELGVRPYPEQGDVQLLPPDTVHEMAMRIGLEGYADRFSIQLLGRPFPENFHQGVWCDLEQNPGFDPDEAVTNNVSVHVWPDNDGDGIADGYTITTGTFDSNVSPTTLTHGPRRAAICSNAGQQVCQGPSDSDLCNLIGEVDVQFTLTGVNQ